MQTYSIFLWRVDCHVNVASSTRICWLRGLIFASSAIYLGQLSPTPPRLLRSFRENANTQPFGSSSRLTPGTYCRLSYSAWHIETQCCFPSWIRPSLVVRAARQLLKPSFRPQAGLISEIFRVRNSGIWYWYIWSVPTFINIMFHLWWRIEEGFLTKHPLTQP